MSKSAEYDSSWDDGNESLWDKKYKVWQKRDWEDYLEENLTFPFQAVRFEDLDSNPFADNKDAPFSVGHTVEVLDIEDDDEMRGLIVKVKEGRKKGYLMLCELEVASKEDRNFWPVREYVVWFANR